MSFRSAAVELGASLHWQGTRDEANRVDYSSRPTAERCRREEPTILEEKPEEVFGRVSEPVRKRTDRIAAQLLG